MNPFYTNMFNCYMYLAVEDRKSENPFVGHVLSDEWNPYHYIRESASAVKAKKEDVEKVGIVSEEVTLIKSTVVKATKNSKDDAKSIQDEEDVQREVPNSATEKELKEVVTDIEKEYSVFESMGDIPSKHSLLFPLPVEESDLDLLFSYVNQSLMTASN